MSHKVKVEVRIESNSSDQQLIQSVSGDVYLKDEAVYIRYPEPDPSMGETTTTVKVKDNQVKVIRHGGVQSEQAFSLNKQEWGTYMTPQGNLELVTKTDSLDIQLGDGLGRVAWAYRLWVSGDFAGKFNLKLDIQGSAE